MRTQEKVQSVRDGVEALVPVPFWSGDWGDEMISPLKGWEPDIAGQYYIDPDAVFNEASARN